MELSDSKCKMLEALKERFSNCTVCCDCTLEEFYHGCIKKIDYERIILVGDGTKQKMEVVKKNIQIKPGMGVHTWLTFPGEGN